MRLTLTSWLLGGAATLATLVERQGDGLFCASVNDAVTAAGEEAPATAYCSSVLSIPWTITTVTSTSAIVTTHVDIYNTSTTIKTVSVEAVPTE